ncbi:MAG: rod shape-determining protein MreC [Coriobacteriia bacterium]|nr:rod shape-determining protein MreC [Coriobacteriia bacterium]
MALAPHRPKRVSAGIVTIVLSLLSIVLMTVWLLEGASGPLHKLRAGSMAVTAPIQQVGRFLGLPFNAANNATSNMTADPEDVAELRRRNEELQALVLLLKEHRLENERLKDLLRIVDAYNLAPCGARIISRTTDSWNRTVTIDKGSLDGITIGMPVVSANGLMGQIESVGPFSSTVRLLTDPRSGVAVYLQETRTEAVMSGSQEGLLYLSYISLDAPVNEGEAVITSGVGGVYPKGIVIGVVFSIFYNPTDMYKTVVVAPVEWVDYPIGEVSVLTGRQSEVTYKPPVSPSQEDQSTSTTSGLTGTTGEGS